MHRPWFPMVAAAPPGHHLQWFEQRKKRAHTGLAWPSNKKKNRLSFVKRVSQDSARHKLGDPVASTRYPARLSLVPFEKWL